MAAPTGRSGPGGGWGAPGGDPHPVPIAEVDTQESTPRPTGVSELDRVLGGGLVPGSVTVLGGEPGIGKSTLLLQTLSGLADAGTRCLLVSAEESRQQVRLRAERLGVSSPRVMVAAETSLASIVGAIDQCHPGVVVVDSIQTVFHPEVGSAPGSVGQVRECAHRLVTEAKHRAMATILVGHVTKDGALAGPRVLEHLVDTVLSFEGERHHALRLLRAVKHRFGSTNELGLFEMAERGLVAVPDAGSLFLSDRRPGTPGCVVVPTVEGHRPLVVEIQALTVDSDLALPRRSAQGLDPGRLTLLAAVLDRRAGVKVAKHDIYASAVGGVRVAEPGADLAMAVAVASSRYDVAVAPDVVVCGEVGLGGEVRQVAQTSRRLAEAVRLGFRRAVLAMSSPEPPPGITALRAATVADALVLTGVR
jgi:DNA repair protein RadA/Sms